MKVLIMRVSAIGDVVHTLPAVFLIKRYCPQAKISWVVQKKAADLLLNQPFLENVFVLNNKFLQIKNLYSTMKTVLELRKTNWDIILDFQGICKTSLILSCLNGIKFGFSYAHARSEISSYFTHIHINPEYKNIIQKNLSLASHALYETFGMSCSPTTDNLKKDFALEFGSEDINNVNEWLATQNIKNFIFISPNTTWASKHWPEENWIDFIQLFNSKKTGIDLILVGRDFGIAAQNIAQQLEKLNSSVKFVPRFNLREIAYLMSKSKIVIAPDTGLLHLADFLGVKAIGIFGPTNKDLLGGFLNKYNIENAIQCYVPDRWNLKKTTKAHNYMYKLNARVLIDKVIEDLK